MNAATVRAIVTGFHDPSDGAAMKSRELVLMLLDAAPDPFSRSHFAPGHITGTGFVLGPDGASLLLVHHRRLGRWLLPGGHVEPDDAEIWDASRREVVEETGAVLVADPAPRLAGIDVHGIPAAKGEPYHLHHDLIFAFRATSAALQVSEESHAVAWCAPAEFDRYSVPDNVRRSYTRMVT